MKRKVQRIGFWLVLLVFTFAVHVQQAQPSPQAQSTQLPQPSQSAQPTLPAQPEDDLFELLALIQKAGGPDKYPEANALVILDKEHIVVQDNGEFTSRSHSLVKILTDKGRQVFATRKIP